MKKPIVYGIPNCDSIKKTLDWFREKQLTVHFHDYKQQGISAAQLKKWIEQAGIDAIFNKRSSTWRALQSKTGITNPTVDEAIALMLDNNSIIKRPVVEVGEKILVGFNSEAFDKTFKTKK